MKKILLKKIIFTGLTLIFTLSFISFLPSCAPPKLTFENIVISSNIEKDTNKPADEKTEFDIAAQHIYATIKYTGVKGGDNWSFKWTYLDTGEVVLDKGDQYDKKHKEQYFNGIAESDIYPLEKGKVIPPGNYKVEFYNNGELAKTTTFKVSKPQIKILEVSLANQIDKDYAPVNTTQKFSPSETVYACVKVDYQIIGNNIKALWKDSKGEILSETKTDLTIDYYKPSFIAFSFQWNTGIIPAGNYKVEIYLNDIMYGSFDFEVLGSGAASAVTFDKGEKYYNAKYGFTIAIPDNWTYKENKTQNEVSLNINPPSQDLPLFSLFKATGADPYKPYDKFAANDAESFSKQQNWTFAEKSENDSTLKNGTPYKEYFYHYTDKNNGKWVMSYCFAENKANLYLFIVIANESQADTAQAAYSGILNSLTFN